MISYPEHTYHPYENDSLGFFLMGNKYPHELFGSIVQDIDLYYQPTPSPLIGTLFFFIRTLLVVTGEAINIKVFNIIKKDTSLVSDVSKLYFSTQMIYVPFWLIFTTFTDFIHPLNTVIGQWFCTLGWFLIYFGATTLAIHSFIVAMMRYCFIIHKRQVEGFGIQKTKRMFLFLNICIPLIMILWTGIEGVETEPFSFLNKCYGKDHKRFLTDVTSPDVIKRSFCMLETYDVNGPFGEIIAILRRLSCISTKTVYIVMGFNITEAILYYMILSHMNR